MIALQDRLKKADWCDSYEKHPLNVREWPHGWFCKSAKHPKTCEKHGGMGKTVWGVKTLQIKKQNISRKVNYDHKSTSKTECAYTWHFLRIKKLEQSQYKILQPIKKQSRHHRNEHVSTMQECPRKSQKAHRHWISPDTSCHLRQVTTGIGFQKWIRIWIMKLFQSQRFKNT
jgi:hypothetical protein